MALSNKTSNTKVRKVGHLMPYPAIGGTEHATLRMAKITRGEGFENHFFVPAGFNDVRDFFADDGFSVSEIDQIEPSLTRSARYYVESRKAAKIYRELGIDLLHAADLGAGFRNGLAARCGRIPIICHVRSRHPEINLRNRVFLSLVNHWVFVSTSAKNEFAARATEARSDILYEGIEIPDVSRETKSAARQAVLAEFGLKNDTLIVGCLARVSHQKDHLTLAKAVLELSQDLPNVVVLAIGPITREGADANSYATLVRFIEDHGLQDKFILGGFRADVQQLMAAFDIHVLPTHYEGFGLVIHEAMVQRTPVISTAVGGTVEAMTDGIGGFLVDHGDAAGLASKMRVVLGDRELAAKMGDDGYEFVKANFSSERFRERILDIYKKVLTNGPYPGDSNRLAGP